MDMFNATFLQSHYTIIYNVLTPRVPQNSNKESETTTIEETTKEPINWRNVSQDKLRICIARGVQSLQVGILYVPLSFLFRNKECRRFLLIPLWMQKLLLKQRSSLHFLLMS